MKQPVVLIGNGEMGGVFARGLLRLGHPVYPVNHHDDLQAVAAEAPTPLMVLIAVGEADLPPLLAEIPDQWSDRLGLLQNELLPNDWQGIDNPTVISVWFEKKRGMDAKVIIPSPVYGPHSQLLHDALATLEIPTRMLADSDQLQFELVVKNLYILTSNIAGLQVGGNVGQLWSDHQPFARELIADIISLQEAMTGSRFDHPQLISAVVTAFNGDTGHNCMGRSAPARLQRALENGRHLGLELPTLHTIASDTAT